MKNKNIITIVLLIILIFGFLISRNENFMYEFNKMKSGIFISLLYKVFPDPVYKFPEYTSEQLDKMFEGVEPYTGDLPPIPDKKLNDSTLLGIDSNNNGVRDDLEIWIVEHFGRDKMLVESFFAYVRSDALDMIIQRDGLFTDELYENDITIRDTLDLHCKNKYLKTSNFGLDSTDRYFIVLNFEKQINNTEQRKINAKNYFSNFKGRVGKSGIYSLKECNNFFQETKTYKIY